MVNWGLPNDITARFSPPAEAEGASFMTAQMRLILLALALTYSLVFGPAGVFASGMKLNRHKVSRMRATRSDWFHVKRTVQPAPLGARAADYAKRFIGVPYRWGGSSPSGFDCSGLVRFVYQRFGINLPHSSYADFNLGRRVSRWALKPGDLVFFSGVGHVGMYVGNGRFIHAPHSGTRVQISAMSDHGGYDGARRIVAGAKRHLLRG
jgi:cell wall-associated NlpC family hydrolase